MHVTLSDRPIAARSSLCHDLEIPFIQRHILHSAGKSTVSRIAAHALRWQVIELTELFHEELEKAEYADGSDHTPDRVEILDYVLAHRRFEKIIVCDVDDILNSTSQDLIQRFGSECGPVIHVTRSLESVWTESLESGRVDEEDREVWVERWSECEKICRRICSYEFVSLDSTPATTEIDESSYRPPPPPFKSVERDFTRLLRFILGIDTNHIYVGPTAPQSYFLALTYNDVSMAIPHLDELSIGIDCWEIRADLLRSWDLTFLAHQVAILRAASDLPILFTMRTQSQGGRFPDPRHSPELAAQYNEVTQLAIKLGVEYVDVELWAGPAIIHEAMALKGNTKVILSWHDWTGKVSWLGNEVRQIYEAACKEGADVVKMIGWARSFQDNLNLREFAQTVQARGKVPLLAVNMGAEVGLGGFFSFFGRAGGLM
jgi:3-dehydroquinate dehydratase type I